MGWTQKDLLDSTHYGNLYYVANVNYCGNSTYNLFLKRIRKKDNVLETTTEKCWKKWKGEIIPPEKGDYFFVGQDKSASILKVPKKEKLPPKIVDPAGIYQKLITGEV